MEVKQRRDHPVGGRGLGGPIHGGAEEVGRIVVAALLRIAFISFLRPHIPVGIWAWLKKEPPFTRTDYQCLTSETEATEVLRHVRALGDVEILKSYLVLVWSEWNKLRIHVSLEMDTSIREDFSGIWMWCHREDLTRRLDHILAHPQSLALRSKSAQHYGSLKRVLLEVDREATEILTSMSPRLIVHFD